MERINCRRCVHFFVTWEPAQPYGCRYYGFKSPLIPSQAVFNSSGIPCQMFQPRPKASGEK